MFAYHLYGLQLCKCTDLAFLGQSQLQLSSPSTIKHQRKTGWQLLHTLNSSKGYCYRPMCLQTKKKRQFVFFIYFFVAFNEDAQQKKRFLSIWHSDLSQSTGNRFWSPGCLYVYNKTINMENTYLLCVKMYCHCFRDLMYWSRRVRMSVFVSKQIKTSCILKARGWICFQNVQKFP